MNHGTYCSFYSLVPPAPCTQPASLDANCNTATGCPGTGCVSVLRRDKAAKDRPGQHHTAPDLALTGIDAPTKEELAPGAKQVDTMVVEFCKRVTTQGAAGQLECHGKKTLIAKVFIVKVKPTEARDKDRYEERTFGVGYQIKGHVGKPELWRLCVKPGSPASQSFCPACGRLKSRTSRRGRALRAQRNPMPRRHVLRGWAIRSRGSAFRQSSRDGCPSMAEYGAPLTIRSSPGKSMTGKPAC